MIPIRRLLLSLAFCSSALTMHAPHAADADPSIDDAPLTAEEQADVDQWERFVADSLKSSDLRLRVLLSFGEMVLRGKSYVLVETVPLESLVEQARGSTDPLVLASLLTRCGTGQAKQPRCDALDLARRWTGADTQNQVAWLTLAAVLKQQGDLEGARATFTRAAQASMWHDHFGDAARTVARALPRALPPRARLHALVRAIAIAAAFALPDSALWTTSAHCKDEAMRDACLRILDTLSRDTDNLLSMRMAAGLTERIGAPETTTRARRQRADAIYWGALMDNDRSIWEPRDAADVARAIAHLEQIVELGEVAVGQRNLAKAGIPETDAAARFARSRGR